MYQVRLLLCEEGDLGGVTKVKGKPGLDALKRRLKFNIDVVLEKLCLKRSS